MEKELFERLLYEEEGTTLDFKKEQYRFARATDEDKSELLKDILGFGNAWRRSQAYILIGVEDVRGGRANVVGITANDHLDDHSLQQFVNNLTNQPVHFHYVAFGFEGKQVGIISIDEQIRPVYLKRNYGRLVKEKVYVRRGSSTDPTKPATLEEIAQMRVGSYQPVAELLVEFAHLERDDALGNNISWDVEVCEVPAMELIPDLPRPRQSHPFDFSAIQMDVTSRPNDNFFRELAAFEFARRLFRPARLVVKNVGQVAATSVRAEITVPMDARVVVLESLPKPPKQRVGLMRDIPMGRRPGFLSDPGEVSIDRNDERYRVEIDCGDLQPGRRVWSDVFYIGKMDGGDISLCGLIFADNLPQPRDFALTISGSVARTTMSVDELCSLPEQTEDED